MYICFFFQRGNLSYFVIIFNSKLLDLYQKKQDKQPSAVYDIVRNYKNIYLYHLYWCIKTRGGQLRYNLTFFNFLSKYAALLNYMKAPLSVSAVIRFLMFRQNKQDIFINNGYRYWLQVMQCSNFYTQPY